MKRFITLFIIVNLLHNIYTQGNVVKIGTSLSTQSTHPFDMLAVPILKGIYKFFEYWVNNHYDLIINGEKYQLDLIMYEDDRSFESMKENFLKLVTEDNVDLLLGGSSIDSFIVSADIAEEYGRALLVMSPVTNIYENKTSVFNVYPNTYSQLQDILPLLRVAGVKSVHALELKGDVKACYHLEEIMKENNIDELVITEYTDETIDETVDKIIELDKDLFLYCSMNLTNFNNIAELFYKKKYVPRSSINLSMDKYNLDTRYVDYWIMYHYYLEGVDYPDTKYIGSYENLKKLATEYFKNNPDYYLNVDNHKATILLIWTKIELALNGLINSRLTSRYSIIDSIRRSKYDSLIGKISFASDNTHLISGIGYQIINNDTKNLLFPGVLSNATLVYPSPTYEERVKNSGIKEIEIAVYVFVSILIINSALWILYIFLNKDKTPIKSSSPIFLIGMLIGSIVIYSSLIPLSPSLVSTTSCILTPWLLSIGFILLFGSLLVKTWRVHLIFSKKTLEVFSIPNRQVLIFLSLLLLIDIALLSAWTGISKMNTNEIIIDEYRINQNYDVCKPSIGGRVMMWIVIAYKVLMIIYGGYLALRVRTIPVKIYDESRIIAFCIYNVGLSAIIIAVLQATSPTGRYIIFGINSFLILVSCGVTINSMFITKWRSVVNKDKKSTSTSGNDRTQSFWGSTTMGSFNNQSQIDANKLKKKNEKLKSQIKKLKKELEECKEELNKIKEKNGDHDNENVENNITSTE